MKQNQGAKNLGDLLRDRVAGKILFDYMLVYVFTVAEILNDAAGVEHDRANVDNWKEMVRFWWQRDNKIEAIKAVRDAFLPKGPAIEIEKYARGLGPEFLEATEKARKIVFPKGFDIQERAVRLHVAKRLVDILWGNSPPMLHTDRIMCGWRGKIPGDRDDVPVIPHGDKIAVKYFDSLGIEHLRPSQIDWNRVAAYKL